MTLSPQRTIPAFGRRAGNSWLQELGGEQQRGQLFGTLAGVHMAAAVVAGASIGRVGASEPRFSALAAHGLRGGRKSQLPTARMQGVRKIKL